VAAGTRPGEILPAILGLHDHAGQKYFGWRKIAQISPQVHPHMAAHRAKDYGGLAWANQAAKRGFAVLVHDTFPFGSRRVRPSETSDFIAKGLREPVDDDLASIEAYNRWAGEHESIMAKSLFCAGTTWPGVYLREDQVALSILAARPEVDAGRLVCAGLSGGGMRTVFLAGLDPRIRCCACIGFMTTWRDFALNVSPRHTWMTYVPLAANDLDFPEILGLRVPRPVLVQSTRHDPLYTLAGMRAAGRVLRDVYRTAGVPERCRVSFYDGGHKFDGPMQDEAFAWFERWLR
jgi:dienelactone hydrolase